MGRWIDRARLRIRSLTRGEAVDRELDRELQAHRQAQIEEYLSAGLTPTAARQAAARQFGGVVAVQEACRDTRRVRTLDNIARDLRYACRQLLHQPVFAIAAIAAIALGAGANALVLGLAHEVVLSTPTATRADRLVTIRTRRGSHESYPAWERLANSGALGGIAGYSLEEQVNWRSADASCRLTPLLVTPNYFDLLGVPGVMGRAFSAEDVTRHPDLVVISHGFWQRSLGADPAVIGRTLMLNGRPYTIVAVLPAEDRTPIGYGLAPEVYLPMSSTLLPGLRDEHAAAASLVGRLREGQSLRQGRAALQAVLSQTAVPGDSPESSTLRDFNPFGAVSASGSGPLQSVALFFVVLEGLAALVFLIACANIAGLLIARSAFRRPEIALRLALGAGRARLVQQLLTEGFVLAAIGTTCGLGLSLGAGRLLQTISLPLPLPIELHLRLDGTLLLVAAGLVLVGTFLSSLLPALSATRLSLAPALKRDAQPRALRRFTVRRTLVAGQIAVSCVLLVIGALFVRNLMQTALVNPGFDLDHTLMVQVAFVEGQQGTGANPKVAAMAERVQTLPGIDTAAFAKGLPLTIDGMSSTGTEIRIGTRPEPVRVTYDENLVGPGYFAAMGIRLLRGREFDTRDRPDGPRTVIVSEEFARRYLPEGDPLGATLRLPGPPGGAGPAVEIIGLVANSKYRTLGEDLRPAIYESYLQRAGDLRLTHLILRTAGPPAAAAKAVRKAILAVDDSAAVTVQPMRDALAFAFLPSQMGAALTMLLGLVGLVLATIGLHGVVAYAMSQRLGEIGIRLTLGASRRAILRLVVADTAVMAGLGIALGLGLAALTTPVLSAFLVGGLSPIDPISFGGTALVLGLVSFTASIGPVRRALRLDPSAVLKTS